MRAAAAITAVGVTLLVTACGEKQENLEAVPETTTELGSVPAVPEASVVQVQGAGAKALARTTASARVAPGFVIAPAAWKVRCKYGDPARVSCSVVAGLCRGAVLIRPTKVPAGESAEDYSPRADASRVRCKSAKKR